MTLGQMLTSCPWRNLNNKMKWPQSGQQFVLSQGSSLLCFHVILYDVNGREQQHIVHSSPSCLADGTGIEFIFYSTYSEKSSEGFKRPFWEYLNSKARVIVVNIHIIKISNPVLLWNIHAMYVCVPSLNAMYLRLFSTSVLSYWFPWFRSLRMLFANGSVHWSLGSCPKKVGR